MKFKKALALIFYKIFSFNPITTKYDSDLYVPKTSNTKWKYLSVEFPGKKFVRKDGSDYKIEIRIK